MTVFRHEFRRELVPALIWSASLGLLGFFFLTIYPSFQKDIQPMLELMKSYPPEALKALGMDGALQTFPGFYSFILVYPILCGSIQAIIAGIGVISKEGARKTSDFLFTKPISRPRVLLEKYGSVFFCMLITGAGFILITFLGCQINNITDFDAKLFWLFSGAFVLTQLFCLSIGFCIGCFLPKLKSPNGAGIGIGALFFALQMAANLTDDSALRFFSPMSYLNPGAIAKQQGYDTTMLSILIALTIGLAALGMYRYCTRDIHSA